ncbi:hypothetical protein DhcVS_306 [Dehalococcoides mccartyi VS]|uniref:Uncharacterized protein n=1 Tax=Dehalococcoides mccartyi (strain VS) TaxID=311424 RepID=D2BGL5_DEHMV|nr:hypothetical protein DhcVS_306 [Dehalococcoides mccartyi VS]
MHLCEEGIDQTIAGLDILLAASFLTGMFYL